MMTPQVKAQWVNALRSGAYEQGQFHLKRQLEGWKSPRYCCLGVLAEVLGAPQQVRLGGDQMWWEKVTEFTFGERKYESQLPARVLSGKAQGILMDMNDGLEMSFTRIADWIEAHL